MKERIIIAIGRQFGSGGREIGKKLADALGIAYYDKELLAVAAKESGLNREVFEKADEQTSSLLTYALSMGFAYFGSPMPENNFMTREGIFKIQSDTILGLAERESCVIVGRCADYILRDNPSMISFFISDTMPNRVLRVVNSLNVSVDEARDLLAKTDKSRAAYYNYYTDKKWGAAASYHFCVDVSVLGVDRTVAYMKLFVEEAVKSRTD